MTVCELITKPITRMVDEGKSLDEIAESVCPTVKYGRAKIIRVIKDFLGEDYLNEHAVTLKYDIEKAQLARTKKSYKKIDATADEDSEESKSTGSEKFENLINTLQKLLREYTIDEIEKALEKALATIEGRKCK